MPPFVNEVDKVENELYLFIEKSGLLTVMLKAMPEKMQMDTVLDIMDSEAIKTSEIEGEFLSRIDVMSSDRNNLGLTPNLPVRDKRAQGVGSLMISVRNTYSDVLTEKTLFDWHPLLMGYRKDIEAGKWRTPPNLCISFQGLINNI